MVKGAGQRKDASSAPTASSPPVDLDATLYPFGIKPMVFDPLYKKWYMGRVIAVRDDEVKVRPGSGRGVGRLERLGGTLEKLGCCLSPLARA